MLVADVQALIACASENAQHFAGWTRHLFENSLDAPSKISLFIHGIKRSRARSNKPRESEAPALQKTYSPFENLGSLRNSDSPPLLGSFLSRPENPKLWLPTSSQAPKIARVVPPTAVES